MLPNPIPIPFPIEWQDPASPNFKKGRTSVPDMIVIHIADGMKQSVIQQFKNPSTQVSSHLLVCQDGSYVQFVSTVDTAYCNGVLNQPVSELVLQRGQRNPNDYTISIETEGFGTNDILPAQYTALSTLVKFLSQKWNIPLDRTHVIGHREITGTKECPGRIDVERVIRGARY